MTSCEALYDKPYKSPMCWIEVGKSSIIILELIPKTTIKINTICEHLLGAQSRHESHANNERRTLEFQEREITFNKVQPRRQIIRFGKNGKLSLRYIGSFEI